MYKGGNSGQSMELQGTLCFLVQHCDQVLQFEFLDLISALCFL